MPHKEFKCPHHNLQCIIIIVIQIRLGLMLTGDISALCGRGFPAPHQRKQLRLTSTDMIVFSKHNNESLYRRRMEFELCRQWLFWSLELQPPRVIGSSWLSCPVATPMA